MPKARTSSAARSGCQVRVPGPGRASTSSIVVVRYLGSAMAAQPRLDVVETQSTARAAQRAQLLAVLPEGDDLSELRELLDTAGVAPVGATIQHRDRPHPDTYVGKGKLEELKASLKQSDAN